MISTKNMKFKASRPDEYFARLSKDRQEAMSPLRSLIVKQVPPGYAEQMGMIGYLVPHSIFSEGYHCHPNLPLALRSIALQKNLIA
jgi:hypothetical protein